MWVNSDRRVFCWATAAPRTCTSSSRRHLSRLLLRSCCSPVIRITNLDMDDKGIGCFPGSKCGNAELGCSVCSAMHACNHCTVTSGTWAGVANTGGPFPQQRHMLGLPVIKALILLPIPCAAEPPFVQICSTICASMSCGQPAIPKTRPVKMPSDKGGEICGSMSATGAGTTGGGSDNARDSGRPARAAVSDGSATSSAPVLRTLLRPREISRTLPIAVL
mmetsp:Transcript_15011/g.33096  ORF Transcript_15011/g.33096 Transcript_15011/m.33096 type:complete len:220 (+) Transcript_15011:174-833(+)